MGSAEARSTVAAAIDREGSARDGAPQWRVASAELAPEMAWLTHANTYRASGLLNEEMLRILVIQAQLRASADRRWVYDFLKGSLDRVAAACLIVLFSPLFLAVALGIKLTSRGPVFYSQVRVGRFMSPFHIFKFRTMHVGADRAISFVSNEASGGLFKSRGDPRVTSIGRWLRRLSIDELPQLFNVLLGQMSLVGPRPLPEPDTATIAVECYDRFAVRPGITGMWQVYAREVGDGRVKVQMDCDYVARRGALLDLKLLILTIPRVLGGKGAC